MSDLYNAAPGTYGGFTSPIPGGSSSKGWYQQPMNLPFYEGRSILATIPEYQRNPFLFEKDLMFKISEGRANLMKIIMEQAEMGGGIEVPDVRYRLPIEVDPTQRVYLDIQSSVAVTAKGLSTFKIRGNTTKISTAMPGGNLKQVGDIARLEKDQFIMLMFSWVEPRRTAAVALTNLTFYSPQAIQSAPVPEICKIVSVDYANSKITVERYWAGEQRTTTPTYSNIPSFSVHADGTTSTWQSQYGSGTVTFEKKYAFFVPMAKSMKEDEIDAKIRNFSGTWTHGILQRHLMAWGSQRFAEVISANMGLQSPLTKSKQQAIKDFYDHWELMALFGEKHEEYDAETGYWSGTTDGLLANIPKSHYWTIKGIDYATGGFTAGKDTSWGSFHPIIFDKVMEGKAYMGSSEKVLVCGSAFHTSFSAMINFMTQAVPEIKSEWNVIGRRFKTSNGLTITVVPSDKMSLNGLSHSAILYDKQYFKPIKLKNYPSADIYEIQNENPLKSNGFIHGVKGFIDLNPDAHWVFTVAEPTFVDDVSGAAASFYASLSVLGAAFSS